MSPQKIFQFEKNIDTGVIAGLTALGATPVFAARDDEASLPSDRIVVDSSPFTRASEQQDFCKAGVPFYNHFSGKTSIIITTKRNPASAAQHDAWIGLVRRFFSAPQADVRILPYDILSIKDSGGSVTFLKDGERDRSELNFEIELGIPGPLMDYADSSA